MTKKTKGLLVVNTGDGKGKTTAALGVVFRSLGRDIPCAVVQFVKGKWETGERKFAATLPQLEFHTMGLGFTWDSDDLDKDKKAARHAWDKCIEIITKGEHQVVVFDEITYAFHYGWLTVEEVMDVINKRNPDTHVILTGRNCPKEIIEAADLVSVIQNEKHPYKAGIAAQPGIDF